MCAPHGRDGHGLGGGPGLGRDREGGVRRLAHALQTANGGRRRRSGERQLAAIEPGDERLEAAADRRFEVAEGRLDLGGVSADRLRQVRCPGCEIAIEQPGRRHHFAEMEDQAERLRHLDDVLAQLDKDTADGDGDILDGAQHLAQHLGNAVLKVLQPQVEIFTHADDNLGHSSRAALDLVPQGAQPAKHAAGRGERVACQGVNGGGGIRD